MPESHERFTYGLFEARWQSGEQAEFHRKEDKQSHQAKAQKSEAKKVNQIKIELLNIPVLVFQMPDQKSVENSDPINSNTALSLMDIIEIIFEKIVNCAMAIFQKRKEKI